MAVFRVTNEGTIPRLLGPRLGKIGPGETKYFEGDDAVELDRVINTPEMRGVINKAGGLSVQWQQSAFEGLIAQLDGDPTLLKKIDLGTAVALIEQLKAEGNIELLAKLRAYADRPQLEVLFL